MKELRAYVYPFVVGGMGVGSFLWLDWPLPFLLGPIAACLLAALLGLRLRTVHLVNNLMRTVLGVAVGATLTPMVLSGLGAYWASLMFIPLMVMAIGGIGVPYFRYFCRYDSATSYYAAMPGGLQEMVLLGEEAGGKGRSLSLIHATRVLIIVVTLPFLLQEIWHVDLTRPPGEAATTVPLTQIGLMVIAGLSGWLIAKRVKMFGAAILGPLIVACLFAVSGILHHRPPAEAIWASQFFIGIAIGAKYSGITLNEIRRDILSGIGFCVILVVLTLLMVEIGVVLDLGPAMDTLLAFAPGGQAELTVLAIIVGADLAFVISHHVLRLFMVILGGPILIKWLARPRD